MIKLSGIIKNSITDGIGIRCVIFTQGCSHNCKNCHNPDTHDFNGGYYIAVDDLLTEIESVRGIRGITLSGGDPLYEDNKNAVTKLCKLYKERNPDKTIWLYTGYVFEQLNTTDEIFKYIDVLIDGPFIEDKKSLNIKYRGSTNQRIIDVQKTTNTNKIIELNLD